MLPQENFNPKSTIYCIPAMYLLLGKILCVQIAQWLPWKLPKYCNPLSKLEGLEAFQASSTPYAYEYVVLDVLFDF